MKTINYRVNLGFTKYSDADLDAFTSSNITSLTGNASFPTLPVTVLELGTLQTAFDTALANAAQGGKQLTALKNAARAPLVGALRKNATYVQGIASEDVAMLLSSGYLVNSTNRASVPLQVPFILNITNDAPQTLTVQVQPVSNARAYQVRAMTADGTVVATVDSTASRGIVLAGLVSGTTYKVQSRGIGGSTGYSNWSDAQNHMAM